LSDKRQQRFATCGVNPETAVLEPPMLRLAVLKKGPDWTVLKDGHPLAQGLSRSQAIAMADQLAFESEETEDVEILVQDYTGEVQARYSGPEA
jgi:hypothetical protein